jgi:hypothetical protein
MLTPETPLYHLDYLRMLKNCFLKSAISRYNVIGYGTDIHQSDETAIITVPVSQSKVLAHCILDTAS